MTPCKCGSGRMNAAERQSGAAMFNGPFFHDEMTALAGFEQRYADRLTTMGRKAPKLLTVEVPVEDTLRWLGIDPDAIGDLVVLTREVRYAAGGWLSCECGVAAVVIVGV